MVWISALTAAMRAATEQEFCFSFPIAAPSEAAIKQVKRYVICILSYRRVLAALIDVLVKEGKMVSRPASPLI
jgi:hypothetical protein